MAARLSSMIPPDHSSWDDCVDAYAAHVDHTLLAANLQLTHEQRLLKLHRFVKFLAQLAESRQNNERPGL